MTNQIELSTSDAVMYGAQSLRMFGKMFLPKTYRQESPAFHDDMGAALYSNSRQVAFEVFRGGAKTSLLRCFTMQRVAYAISRTIMFVSISQAHSIHSIRWLKKQIQYNTKLTQTFNLRKGDKWTDEIIEVYHGVDEVPITIMAAGITGQIRGFNVDDFRPDLIVADDISSEETTANLVQREKAERLFFGALLNSLAPETESPSAKIVLLQTPLHKDDIVEKCIQSPDWRTAKYGILDEAGSSRWESRFPTKDVLREKASAIAMRQYQLWMQEKECTLVSGEDTIFDVNRLQHWEVLPDDMQVILSIDPASSNAATADDNVVMCTGFYKNHIYVLDYYAERGVMPDITAARFFEFVIKYRPVKAVVETVSFQRTLKWFIEQEMLKRRIFLPIIGFADRRRKPDRIIQSLAGPLHMGLIHVRPSFTKLIDQLQNYDPLDKTQHDDVVDALSIAVTSTITQGYVIEGEYTSQYDDEEEFELLLGCP